jgi:hypothetical protein
MKICIFVGKNGIGKAVNSCYTMLLKKGGPGVTPDLQIHTVLRIPDIQKGLSMFAQANAGGPDLIVIDGHGMAGYINIGGGMYVDDKSSDCLSSSIMDTPMQQGLTSAWWNAFTQSCSRVQSTMGPVAKVCSPIILLSSCNVAYTAEGRAFLNDLSLKMFPGALVIGPKVYINVKWVKGRVGKLMTYQSADQEERPLKYKDVCFSLMGQIQSLDALRALSHYLINPASIDDEGDLSFLPIATATG